MRNCLVMGFGRSGTSLMGGILHRSGYYMGEELYPARDTNPMGFFENAEINGINEDILAGFDYSLSGFPNPYEGFRASPYHPGTGHRWLSLIPPRTLVQSSEEDVARRIAQAVAAENFAYKDPRFNYTLGTWLRHLSDEVLFLCMFRQPDVVVESVMQECSTATYLEGFQIDRDLAYRLWFNNYSNILGSYYPSLSSRILFIHYEQLLDGSALPALSMRLGRKLDPSFAAISLNRSRPSGDIPTDVYDIYSRLCELSGFLR